MMGGAHRKKTTSGIIVNAGIITNELETGSYQTILEDIAKMRVSDCVAVSAIDILKLPVLRANIQVTSENIEAKEYVEYVFQNLQIDEYRPNGFRYFMEHLLTALDFGIALFEPVWRVEEYKGKMTKRLVYLSPIRPETITEWLYNENVEFIGIKQRRYTANYYWETVQIPASELFIFSFGEEFYDIRGKSILRKARLAWKYKERVLSALARSVARGAGIPKITVGDMADEDTEDLAHTIGRTIGNSDNAYVIAQKDVLDVELMGLQNQASAMELLQYLDRQLLFNTLTQFMTAGIGENGSRAAAAELKTPYELRINDIVDQIEECLNRLIVLVVNESFFTKKEYPKVTLSIPANTALDEIATSIQKLASVNAIRLTEDDEKYIRSIFNLPEIKEEKIEVKEVKAERVKRIPANFEFDRVKEFYTTEQARVDKVIEEIYKDILLNVIKYIKEGREVRREKTKIDEYVKTLTGIYERMRKQGAEDIRKELSKLQVQMSLSEEIKRDKKKITRQVKTLYYDTEQVAENIIENATKKQLAGGIENLLMIKIGDGFKTLRRSISATIMDGYTEGRNDVIRQTEEDILYTYTVALEDIESVCEVCMPLDGLEMTKAEAEAHGLRIEANGRLNPDCLGGDNCRCLLVPTSVRRI